MREDQVQALIAHAANDLGDIVKQYDKALEEKTIPSSLQIEIKNYMENLRSALDYIAHDVYEKHIVSHRASTSKPEIKKIYFPYGKTENDFKSAVGSSLPELKTLSPSAYSIIEAIQPYKLGDNWLYDFCSILNQKKHDTLTPQKREEKKGLDISFGGGAGIKMPPGTSISGHGFIGTRAGGIHLQGDTISGDSPAMRTTGDVKQTVAKWVSFKFDDTNIEVLPLLKKIYAGVEDLSTRIYQTI